MPLTPHPDELAGREVLLLGLGTFGGGAGCARALAARGARLTITDLRKEDQLGESLTMLKGVPFRAAFGGHHEELFERADVVIVNPAVPGDARWLDLARKHSCQLTTQVNLALRLVAEVPTVAITGTHGKSSTAALVHHLLRKLPGRTVLGGNLGGSLLEGVANLTPQDRLVVELSSFQLERLDAPQAWPQIALFTNLRPDHLDRHGDLASYAKAKQRLLAFQDACGLALFPKDEPNLDDFAAAAHGRVERFGIEDLRPEAWGLEPEQLPWTENYRAPALQLAVRAAIELGLPQDKIGESLCDFEGLPHRLQELPAPAPYRLIDNGIATHPEPTAVAIENLRTETPHLSVVIGGHDKALPLGELPNAATQCDALHLFGAGGQKLFNALPSQAKKSATIHKNCADAVGCALAELPLSAATLLFSPSFASFDEFRNFRDRALLFQNFCAGFEGLSQKSPGDSDAGAY
ncbi:MAG: UDP-N-acetylmuramoyl-L-alanine--D-glutamate ligase [Planctomycetes bacterium]|nr:UDP-N-acetylmuramoyl-L-alanine--D-glutamate ligase [Planctomycetota bacterium]